MKCKIQNILFLGLVFILSGCTMPLAVNYDPKPGASAISLKEPLKILIVPYKDERKNPSNKIGDIKATVFGIDSAELILERKPADLVTDAFKEQLILSGFKVVAADNNTQSSDADFLIEGSVKVFKLDIEAKDSIEIEIETRLIDAKNNGILWTGKAEEKNERFAGVMGNTRGTISKYISSSLAKVVKQTLTDVASVIEKSKPQSVEPVREDVILSNEGRIVLDTVPQKVQVYIDDVYYGLSPITIDLAPGTYTASFKLSGFKNVVQKIAVRKGRTTEFSIILEKE
ncbi:MAG: PEGA domain-containing protein [Nitrospirae bacterium]|nr:PEGA domain-containing protein [Nitrospirota bacterium]